MQKLVHLAMYTMCMDQEKCSKGKIQPDADMIFVQNFTQPDFQAKSFTPQKCVICDSFFLRINSVNASNINNLGIFWL